MTARLSLATLLLLLPLPAAAQLRADAGAGVIECAAATPTAGQCLQTQLQQHYADLPVEVEVTPLADDSGAVRSIRLLRQGPSPRLPVAVIADDGREATRWYRVALYRQVPVWSRDGAAGAPAARGAPVLLRSDIAAYPDLVQAAQTPVPDLAGTTLRRDVRAGAVVLAADLRPADAIAAGDTVRYEVRSPRITLSGTGLALEDGRLGAPLKVMPANSKQPIHAIAAEKP